MCLASSWADAADLDMTSTVLYLGGSPCNRGGSDVSTWLRSATEGVARGVAKEAYLPPGATTAPFAVL